jgi:hypothetical protein
VTRVSAGGSTQVSGLPVWDSEWCIGKAERHLQAGSLSVCVWNWIPFIISECKIWRFAFFLFYPISASKLMLTEI